MKKRNDTKRSTLGLIASGVATISIGHRMPEYRLGTTGQAMKRDSQAIKSDAKKVYRKLDREYA
jgi:hypothetical protein